VLEGAASLVSPGASFEASTGDVAASAGVGGGTEPASSVVDVDPASLVPTLTALASTGTRHPLGFHVQSNAEALAHSFGSDAHSPCPLLVEHHPQPFTGVQVPHVVNWLHESPRDPPPYCPLSSSLQATAKTTSARDEKPNTPKKRRRRLQALMA
jgi:hypothetical protein